jgi:hypothetical protein
MRRAFPEFRPLEAGMFNEDAILGRQPGDWRELKPMREWGKKVGKVLGEMRQPQPERRPPEVP